MRSVDGANRRRMLVAAFTAASLVSSACKSVPTVTPPVTPPAPRVQQITWQQKIGWIVRLEDQRLIRDPNPPAPAVLRPPTGGQPAIVAAAPPSDLVSLLTDREPRVRARAALALGRVGLRHAIEPLVQRLADPETDVRQTAAFALGLIGDAAARPPLIALLADASPIVQGRAAEALGLIGDKSDGAAISGMVRAHLQAGALSGVSPDEIGYPLAPPVEAVRLGIYALTRLASFEPLAATVLGPDGQPVSAWWPVAYALQRVPDARGVPALVTLLDTPGRYTASFAAKGLARTPPPQAIAALRRVVEQRRADPMVVVQAMRSLAASNVAEVAPALIKIVRDPSANPVLKSEAVSAFAGLAGHQHVDLVLDLLSDASSDVRATAMRALVRVDPDSFLSALASLDNDADWRVRAAQAEALGKVAGGQGIPRLRSMLADDDARVIPAVLAALVAAKASDAERMVAERLKAQDFAVRAAAANALADLKAVKSIPALADAYRAARDEPTYVARAAALSALDRLDHQAARPILTEALKDRDWAVRVRAAELLRGQGVTDVNDTMRPAAAGRPVDDADWQRIVAPQYAPKAYIDTTKGTIEIDLAIDDAPLTTENFVTLARKGFFNGLRIHRVVPDFVVQGGDPRGDGEGGPGYTIRDEINERPYLRGTVGMALDWEDTGGSQFFITHSPQPHLDGRYTVFGHVVTGMTIVDSLTQADVIERVRIWDGLNQP
ncbi:MAG TPA: HEAT repeat domain-containing protein [Vicinamibacterales bacterium]|nr:HEAT repeat domain-containing protein [Vicinamibacterales bacterium]